MILFRKNSNLCDHNSPTLQTDRQTTCDGNTALCTKVHRAVKMHIQRIISPWIFPIPRPTSPLHSILSPFPEMTYTVSSGTLNLTQPSTIFSLSCCSSLSLQYISTHLLTNPAETVLCLMFYHHQTQTPISTLIPCFLFCHTTVLYLHLYCKSYVQFQLFPCHVCPIFIYLQLLY